MGNNAWGVLAVVIPGLVVMGVGIGCTSDESESAWTPDEARDPILEGLQSSGAWELAPHKAKISSEPVEDRLFDANPDEYAAAMSAAMQDPTWYAADGTRYEAMFVLPDGTAYGRRGPAPQMPSPTKAQDWGARFGAETGPGEGETDGGAQGSVYTNVGQDERTRRQNSFPLYPLQQFPARAVGALSSSGNTMSGGCSGTNIGPRAVLTASHCVYNPTTGAWTTSGFYNPGQTNTATPNGSHAWAGVYARDYVAGGRQADYAVLFVADSAAFYNLGWMGVEWSSSASWYSGQSSRNRGYPCGPNLNCGMIGTQRCADSARSDLRCDGWMYGIDMTLTSDAFWPNNLLAYHNDVSFGHSGSPIFNQNYSVLAVVTHQENQPGCSPSTGCPWYLPCHGPRFRQDMWNDVCSWIADPNYQSAHGQHPLCHP